MINTRYEKDVAIIGFVSEKRLNIIIADELKQELLKQTAKNNCKIIIDLDGISFIDSSGFASLISGYKKAQENKGNLKLVNISSEVSELLNVTKLDTVFDICNDIEDCLQQFSEK